MMMQFHHRHSKVKSVIIFKETSYGGKSMPWGMLRSVRTPNIGINSQKI